MTKLVENSLSLPDMNPEVFAAQLEEGVYSAESA